MSPGDALRKFVLILVALAVSAASGQNPAESDAVLARAREKIVAVAHRLPRYTCLETIKRDYFIVPSSAIHGKVLSAYSAPSCSETLEHPANNLVPGSSDRLRLEVAIADNREIDSWPGATKFDSRHIDEIVGYGPTSTGSFGGYLAEVFENPGAKMEFVGEKMVEGKRVFEYRFQIPAAESHYYVRSGTGRLNTATSGSFEINAGTAELTRLVIETAELPASAGMCQAKTTVDYQQLRIGDGDFLIPKRSEYQTDQIDSSRTKSVNTFSACHEYTAQSTISFDDDSSAAAKAGDGGTRTTAIPVGLSLFLKLTAPIDANTAAAGDAVFATVSKAVAAPGSKAILIPSGARVRGRISEMREFMQPSPHFQVGLVFESVELQGVEASVTLALERERTLDDFKALASPSQGASVSASTANLRRRPADLNIPPPNPRGEGGVFIFINKSGVMPNGFESKWITRPRKP
jgi:hypothetical protein